MLAKLKQFRRRMMRSKKGFTILEVIVSICIFAIISVMLIGTVVTASRLSILSNKMMKDSILVSQAIESQMDSSLTPALPEGVTVVVDDGSVDADGNTTPAGTIVFNWVNK